MLFFPYSKTILLGATIPCMWMNLILLTIYAFNGRTKEKPVDEIEREETRNTEQKRERKPRMEKPGVSSLSIEDYRSLYFHPVRSQMRTAFSINLETLQNLRNVLQDLGERVSIAAYIDNILREHLREHLELLNSAAAKQRRKTTITL